jgi:hypothetical protein
MPRFDLRRDHDTLKPLAPFQVLTVMCCPTDRIRRERMMGDIQATSGAVVDQMINNYKAPVPAADVPAIIDYLMATKGAK